MKRINIATTLCANTELPQDIFCSQLDKAASSSLNRLLTLTLTRGNISAYLLSLQILRLNIAQPLCPDHSENTFFICLAGHCKVIRETAVIA